MSTLLFYFVSQTILAFIATFVGMFIPGILLTKKFLSRLDALSTLVVSFCLGLAVFGMQAYLFGWLHIRWASFIFVLLMVGLASWRRTDLFSFVSELRVAMAKVPKSILLIILIGVVMQSLQMFGNGVPLQSGMNFYRTNAYDGIFHIGLIERMKTTFPPQEPSTTGLGVVNYHYWSDMVMAEQSRLFTVSSLFLFFQWTPILISFLTSLALYRVILMLTRTESDQYRLQASIIGLAFLLLGSDSGWLIPWFVHHQFTFMYPAIDNGPTQFLNMPHVFGKVFFYCVSILFLQWRAHRESKYLVVAMILSAVTFGLKIYFGIALAVGFLLIFFWDGVRTLRKNKTDLAKTAQDLQPVIVSGIVFLALVAIVYLPVNRGAGGLSWYPLEWPKLLVNSENFDWTDLNYRIAIAKYVHNVPKIYFYNGVLVLVGMIAIYGSRMFGFLFDKRTLRLFGIDGILFFSLPALIFTGIGMTTLQDSSAFNVFNFFAVSMSVLVISLGVSLASLIRWKAVIGICVCLVLLSLSLPRSWFEIQTMVLRYRDQSDVVTITPGQREAFEKIRTSKFGENTVVATSLEDPLEMKSTYIPALTGKPVYFAGKYLLETHNQPFQEKEQNTRTLFAQSDFASFLSYAKSLGITTVWVDRKTVSSPADKILESQSAKAVFANTDVLIYDIRNL